MKEPSAKDFGKHALNTSTVGATKASTTMGNSIEDDDDMPVQKTAPAPMNAEKRAALTALFGEYDISDETVDSAKQALDAATKARSDVVKQIAEMIAPLKRISRAGKQLTIVQRGDVAFFRGSKADDTFEL